MSEYVYALEDPETHEVRYIGTTVDPEGRLKQHITSGLKDNARVAWLKSLRAKSLFPTMIILDKVQMGHGLARERERIQEYLAKGAQLTNVQGAGITLDPVPIFNSPQIKRTQETAGIEITKSEKPRGIDLLAGLDDGEEDLYKLYHQRKSNHHPHKEILKSAKPPRIEPWE